MLTVKTVEASWKADNNDDDIPLGEGVLGDNLGVPVVIVCTKSDYIAAHERDLKDDHFDNIQQVIRTLALHCVYPFQGAASRRRD